jgi:hypothetical protein
MKYERRHEQSYNIINSFSSYYHGETNNIELQIYLWLDRRQKYKREAQTNTNQHEQYGGTVHLFIGIGRSLCKFTFMPFIFAIDSWINHRGLNSLFPFRSVPFSAT